MAKTNAGAGEGARSAASASSTHGALT
jgi:hypothetical protein